MKKRFNTKVIHSGHGTDKETGGVMPPIHLSTTFKQNEPGEFKYEYARTKNPSRDVLTRKCQNAVIVCGASDEILYDNPRSFTYTVQPINREDPLSRLCTLCKYCLINRCNNDFYD